MINSAKYQDSYIRLGTSSFSSKDWVGPFYPAKTSPKDYLGYYAQRFNTVEIDSTYYAIPRKRTVTAWKELTPEGFIFAAKFPRSIVHAGKDATPDAAKILTPAHTYKDRDKFLAVMEELSNRLGPLLIQFPYFSQKEFNSAEPFFERLNIFLADLPAGFRFAVEIRNRTWLNQDFANLCRRHSVALALADHAWMPHGDEVEKLFDPVTTDFSYIRLIGDRSGIEKITKTWDKEVINQEESLKRWARVLEHLVNKKTITFAYINNHYAGHAPETARRLWELYQRIATKSQ
jgi:uncharacterized protein YecE (DUF72 family)